MKLSDDIKKYKQTLKSVRSKLFLTLIFAVIIIILFLIIVNNFVLETYYTYNKQKSLKTVYDQVNALYDKHFSQEYIESELEKISIVENFDISIKDKDFKNIYNSGKSYFTIFDVGGQRTRY